VGEGNALLNFEGLIKFFNRYKDLLKIEVVNET